MIKTFAKYLLGLAVAAYVVMVIGIPVYLHYCGGELEKVNYLVKSDSCCAGEENDSETSDNGCCRDEGLVLKSSADFTFKSFNNYDLVKVFSQLFYVNLPFLKDIFVELPLFVSIDKTSEPPKLQNNAVISTFILRV
jgi:hypothetical protein